MKMLVLAALSGATLFAQPPAAPKPVISNERADVYDITIPARTNFTLAAMRGRDAVIVSLAKDTLGETEFRSKDAGGGIRNQRGEAARYAVYVLTDVKIPALENKSGYARAFPRPGIKQLIDNPRVTIWDYSWTPGQPTPVHFHDLDVIVCYLDDGDLESTTPDGAKTLNVYKFGDLRFNKPNRTHKEEVVRGKQRAILTELK
jgi:hypothetical protein